MKSQPGDLFSGGFAWGKHPPHIEKNGKDNWQGSYPPWSRAVHSSSGFYFGRGEGLPPSWFSLLRQLGRSPPGAWCYCYAQGRRRLAPHSNRETETVRSCPCWPGRQWPHRSRPTPWWHRRRMRLSVAMMVTSSMYATTFSRSSLAPGSGYPATPGLALMAWRTGSR